MSTAYVSACDCGWTGGPYRSQAQADYGLRQHSCEKQRARAASRARRLASEARVDRTPKPCRHKVTTHEHGTHACYVLDRCRCRPCADANTTYERTRSRRHAYGRFGNDWVDAAPVREHVQALMAQGMGLKRIVEVSGFSQGGMTKLMYGAAGRGPSKRIRKSTADNLLAVRASIDTLAGGALIDITGTARRLQALMALGWSQTKLAHQLGYEVRNFGYLVHGKRSVTVASARRVRDLYEQLWDQRPPRASGGDLGAYTRTLRYAKARGWVPPLAWDDEAIDDPTAAPFTDTEKRTGGEKFTLGDVEDCIEWGMDRAQAAHRLRVSKSAIEHRCDRDGRLDLLERLDRNALAREAS